MVSGVLGCLGILDILVHNAEVGFQLSVGLVCIILVAQVMTSVVKPTVLGNKIVGSVNHWFVRNGVIPSLGIFLPII